MLFTFLGGAEPEEGYSSSMKVEEEDDDKNCYKLGKMKNWGFEPETEDAKFDSFATGVLFSFS